MTAGAERSALVPQRALVLGLGVTGKAVARALAQRGSAVTATDDGAGADGPARAAAVGATWVDPPADWVALVAEHDGVVPSPGIPERHPIFAAAVAAGVPVRSELDLAAAWDDRPVAVITGTNGKTTVTTLVTDMLVASGIAAVPAGNVEVPLVEAIDDPATEVFVVEASSFRLTFATGHRPVASTWLNFAPDHLDVHLDLEGYEAAKARVWANHALGGTAIANADDPVVMRWAPQGERTQTFGLVEPADWHVDDGWLVGPDGLRLLRADELTRDLPHDRSNALAAAATALAAGASLDGIRGALRAFRSLPHRVELVGEAGGVRWYDDSKATAPHATVAALSGFASAVLIAGGRNKGLDLSDLALVAPHLRAVVAIGDAAGEVEAVFRNEVPTVTARSMDEAVVAAASLAAPGDVVVLSPACASFDWYSSYAERGDDFQRAVRHHLEQAS
ncbi:UDP-N-acetylmuramoyl-L-alanine--D-glutamate ligase [Aquihabitans sp. McL0605]|uniref:UDP-N-acetylmuramoyl-L-alanine--D-glutamate ligase n=1 Tax=Aquihabitans sp. McL0605 TaxID=3415671 RepID=UPI003CF09C24